MSNKHSFLKLKQKGFLMGYKTVGASGHFHFCALCQREFGCDMDLECVKLNGGDVTCGVCDGTAVVLTRKSGL